MKRNIAIAINLCLVHTALAGGIHTGPNRAIILQNPYVAPVVACSAQGSAIAFRSSSNSTAAVTVNKTVTAPAGLASGDGIVAACHIESDTIFITPPSGFTQLNSSTNTATTLDSQLFVFAKLAGGSEPGNYTFTFANAFSQCIMAAYQNVNSGCGPTDTATSAATFTAATVWTAPGITTSYTNDQIFIFQANYDGNTNVAALANLRLDTSLMSLEDELQASAGASGAKVGGTSLSSNGNVIMGGLID